MFYWCCTTLLHLSGLDRLYYRYLCVSVALNVAEYNISVTIITDIQCASQKFTQLGIKLFIDYFPQHNSVACLCGLFHLLNCCFVFMLRFASTIIWESCLASWRLTILPWWYMNRSSVSTTFATNTPSLSKTACTTVTCTHSKMV